MASANASGSPGSTSKPFSPGCDPFAQALNISGDGETTACHRLYQRVGRPVVGGDGKRDLCTPEQLSHLLVGSVWAAARPYHSSQSLPAIFPPALLHPSPGR